MINKSKGFTLVELIVVIAIMAILSTLILVNISRYIVKSKDATAVSDLAILSDAGQRWYVSNGNYNSFFDTALSSEYKAIYDKLNDPNMAYSITTSCDGANNCVGASSAKWCASIPLKAVTATYCVDSSGVNGQGNYGCSGGSCSILP